MIEIRITEDVVKVKEVTYSLFEILSFADYW
jgi:hypothetical protein